MLRAIAEVGTLDDLVSTDFGRLIIAKTALFGLLALLGALNHFVNVPAAGRRLGGLRRIGSVELLVGATVLVLSASLVNLAPPVEAGGGGESTAQPASPAPTAAPLVVTGNDFGTSVRLSLDRLAGNGRLQHVHRAGDGLRQRRTRAGDVGLAPLLDPGPVRHRRVAPRPCACGRRDRRLQRQRSEPVDRRHLVRDRPGGQRAGLRRGTPHRHDPLPAGDGGPGLVGLGQRRAGTAYPLHRVAHCRPDGPGLSRPGEPPARTSSTSRSSTRSAPSSPWSR